MPGKEVDPALREATKKWFNEIIAHPKYRTLPIEEIARRIGRPRQSVIDYRDHRVVPTADVMLRALAEFPEVRFEYRDLVVTGRRIGRTKTPPEQQAKPTQLTLFRTDVVPGKNVTLRLVRKPQRLELIAEISAPRAQGRVR
jgi:hypothetical protein